MKTRTTTALHKVLKLNLSFGDLPPELGFTKPKGFDPISIPWTIPSNSVEEAYSAYLLNRIPGTERTAWMSEVWRVLVPDGKITMIVPYWTSPRSIQDPYSAWPPLSEQSFLYFNKSFREANQIPGIKGCDFDFTYGYTLDPDTAARGDDTRPFWIKHYTNAVADLQIALTKRPQPK